MLVVITQNQPLIIKPNASKIGIIYFLKIIGILTLLAVLISSLKNFISLQDLLYPLESLGVQVSFSSPPLWVIGLCSVILLISIFIQYITAKNTSYEIYYDKIIIHQSQLVIFKDTKEVGFGNVMRVNFNKSDFLKKLFDLGDITVELTGLSTKCFSIKSVDEADKKTQYLQNTLTNYIMRKQQEVAENQKMNQILQRF